MKTSDFDYDLPKSLIAQKPASPRDSSRLLVYSRESEEAQHRIFRELPEILQPGDVLVLNESKVIPARLRTREGREVFLVKEGNRKQETGNSKDVWRCLVRGGKFFKEGSRFEIADPRSGSGTGFSGEVLEVLDSGERVIRFHSKNFEKDLEKYGASPLPPYIHQKSRKVAQYQTTFAKKAGSVAAPTAGLHFTPRIFAKLKKRGITVEKITLHVGLGTFAPVKTEKIEDHPMHAEFFELPKATAERLNKYKKEGRRIIVVGSTSLRVLESCAERDPRGHPAGHLRAQSGETNIFIYPGYKFRFIDGMLTNFHLPKSTLIMLVAAFVGREKTMELYELAKKQKYRFYSFGDAMLLL